ncbi:hypothetical protein NHQ30_009439 [Ciborinia camelliae]|nr:hypothetical protein NHQ30_009439 [Ciborinia camelliae]
MQQIDMASTMEEHPSQSLPVRFADLKMNHTETFTEFLDKFKTLAIREKIPQISWANQLSQKVIPDLFAGVLPWDHLYFGFDQYCNKLQMRYIEILRRKLIAKNEAPPQTPITKVDKSDLAIIRDEGFDNMKHFMDSYGLKPGNYEEFEAAKQIINNMRHYNQFHRKQTPSVSSSLSDYKSTDPSGIVNGDVGSAREIKRDTNEAPSSDTNQPFLVAKYGHPFGYNPYYNSFMSSFQYSS